MVKEIVIIIIIIINIVHEVQNKYKHKRKAEKKKEKTWQLQRHSTHKYSMAAQTSSLLILLSDSTNMWMCGVITYSTWQVNESVQQTAKTSNVTINPDLFHAE